MMPLSHSLGRISPGRQTELDIWPRHRCVDALDQLTRVVRTGHAGRAVGVMIPIMEGALQIVLIIAFSACRSYLIQTMYIVSNPSESIKPALYLFGTQWHPFNRIVCILFCAHILPPPPSAGLMKDADGSCHLLDQEERAMPAKRN